MLRRGRALLHERGLLRRGAVLLHLDPADPPALTAVQLFASRGSGSLAVHAVELCVE